MRAAVLAAVQSPTVWCRERNIPAYGAELLTNGNMETGDPPSNWTATGATLTADPDAQAGVQALKIAATALFGNGKQSNISIAAGTWYRFSGWSKSAASSEHRFEVRTTSLHTSTTWLTQASYGETLLLFRADGVANRNVQGTVWTSGQNALYDSLTWKALTHSTLFGGAYNLPAQIGLRIRCRPTVASPYHAGLAICINPALSYYLLAYHDGTNAHLDKVENGEANYTPLINAAATYGAGRSLRLDITGTIAAAKLDLYYGQDGAETQVGTQQTVDLSSYGLQIRGFRTDVTADWGQVTVERIPA